MRPYVTNIYSNLKSPLPDGEAWSIDLDQRTLFVGSNTSHKSGVIQSVELALAGSADDIFGRSAVSDAALLLTLAPDNELGVSATLSDSQVASFHAKREGTRVKRPTHDGPGAATLVHRSVAAALSGSPASARKAFLAWSGNKIGADDVLAYLPESLKNKYQDISQHKGRGKSAVETLIDVAAYAAQKQREASKEAKGAEIVLESLGDTVEARPNEEDMTRMRMAVAEARSVLDASIRAAGSGMTLSERDAAVKSAKEKHSFFVNQAALSRDTYAKVEATLPKIGANVAHAIKIVDVAVDHSLDACPVCSSQVGIGHLKTCQEFYQKQQSDWEQQSAEKITHLEHIKSDIESYDRHVVETQANVERLEKVSLTQVDSRAIPVSDAQSRLEAAMDALGKMDLCCSQWDNLSEARNKVLTMQGDAATYKELKSSCEAAIGKLLGDQAKTFSARVQKYLPDHWEFSIELLDGEREVFRMGILRDGKLHAALSGAEWTSVVTSIAMAVSEGLPQDQPAVLIPEDRAWDGKTLSAVMRGFSAFDGQVIMASTTRPVGKTPKGWTIVDMDEVSGSWSGDTKEEVVEVVVVEPESVSKTSLNHASGGFRVTTRTAVILEGMGFEESDIQMMSRDTVSHIIKSSISPDNVRVQEDGSFYTVKGGNVLPMPPSPKA